MNCNEFCERLSDFVDGELPEELKGGFATHLDGCAACTAKLQQFRLLSQVLQAGSVDPYAHPLQVDDLYQAHSHQAHAGVSAAVPVDLSADVPENVPVERMWATIAAGLDARESASLQSDGSLPAGSSSTPVSSSSPAIPSPAIPSPAIPSPVVTSSAIPSSAVTAAPVESRSSDRRWHSGAMVALLAIAGMGLWFLPGIVNTSKNNSMHANGSAPSGGSGISDSSAASDKSAASTGASSVNAVIDFQDLLTTGLQPRQALAALSQQFRGKETPPADARALLGYEPSMAQELPGGLQLVSLQVLKLPHCNCPAGKCTCGPGGCNCSVSLCERADGSDLLVVEHCESQPISFGDFPADLVRRAEQEFHFLKAGKQYAATWTANQRRLTAIGVNDLEEAALLIANNK